MTIKEGTYLVALRNVARNKFFEWVLRLTKGRMVKPIKRRMLYLTKGEVYTVYSITINKNRLDTYKIKDNNNNDYELDLFYIIHPILRLFDILPVNAARAEKINEIFS